jgi:SAM-dependent methyltransferase
MFKVKDGYFKRDFWETESLKYVEPHYRLEKCARTVNGVARGRECDLLDVGCGPATLARFLDKNISYYGIDMFIHNPAPNLLEIDFMQNAIGYKDKLFDIVEAAGVFEYMGTQQSRKFAEISRILKRGGKFVVNYTNFNHIHRTTDYAPYNNIEPIYTFKDNLATVFHIDKWFASSHNWRNTEPRRKLLKAVQMRMSIRVPVLSPLLACSYFFICSAKS